LEEKMKKRKERQHYQGVQAFAEKTLHREHACVPACLFETRVWRAGRNIMGLHFGACLPE